MGTPARSDSASAMLKTGERTRTKANKPGEEQITVLPTDIGSTNSQEIFDPTLELAEIMLSMGLAIEVCVARSKAEWTRVAT